MKLKNMNFTKKTLEDIDACQEAIDFCERNGLFCNTQIKNLEITGKYKGWVEWLRFKLNMDYEYDSSDRLVKIPYLDGTTKTYEYNTAGNPTKITYPNGDVETRVYDTAGNLTKIIHPNGAITVYEYKKTENEFTMTCGGEIVLKLHNPEGWV